MELLAKMGFPLDQCRQPWAFVGVGLRRRLLCSCYWLQVIRQVTCLMQWQHSCNALLPPCVDGAAKSNNNLKEGGR